MKYVLIICSAILLAGCAQQGQPLTIGVDGQAYGRFTSTYEGRVTCAESDARNFRACYIVVDSKSGAEYLAVEGCGMIKLDTVPAEKVGR